MQQNQQISEDQEKWYERQNEDHSPPPLPTRIGGAKSAFSKVSSSPTNNYPSGSSTNSSPSIYQHPPPPRSSVNSSKPSSVTSSNKVVFSNYSTPSNYVNAQVPSGSNYAPTAGHKFAQPSATVKIVSEPPTKTMAATYRQPGDGQHYAAPSNRVNQGQTQPRSQEDQRSNDAKVTYLTEYELNNPSPSNVPPSYEYLQHERLQALKPPPEPKKSSYQVDGGHTTDSSSNSDRVQNQHQLLTAQRSEDELSAGTSSSASMSPQQSRRKAAKKMGAAGRNDDTSSVASSVGSGVGVKKRSVARMNANRASANLGSSTLQEDLMKLISPDFQDMGPESKTKVAFSVLKFCDQEDNSSLALLISVPAAFGASILAKCKITVVG